MDAPDNQNESDNEILNESDIEVVESSSDERTALNPRKRIKRVGSSDDNGVFILPFPKSKDRNKFKKVPSPFKEGTKYASYGNLVTFYALVDDDGNFVNYKNKNDALIEAGKPCCVIDCSCKIPQAFRNIQSMTNVEKHMEKFHPELLELVQLRLEKKNFKEQEKCKCIVKPKLQQMKMGDFSEAARSVRSDGKSKTTRALRRHVGLLLSMFLLSSMLAMSPFLLESEGGDAHFFNLLRFLAPALTIGFARSTIKHRMIEVYVATRNFIDSILKNKLSELVKHNVKGICVLSDFWSTFNNQMHFGVVVVCFIANNRFHKICLNLRPFAAYERTGRAAAIWLQATLEMFGIKPEHISTITCDAGSDLSKCTEILNVSHLHCFSHGLHLSVYYALGQKKFKDGSTSNPDAAALVKRLLKIVASLHRSGKMQQQVELFQAFFKEKILKMLDCSVTRWMGIYSMFVRMLVSFKSIKAFLIAKDEKNDANTFDDSDNMTAADFRFMELAQYVAIMRPVYLVTKRLQGSGASSSIVSSYAMFHLYFNVLDLNNPNLSFWTPVFSETFNEYTDAERARCKVMKFKGSESLNCEQKRFSEFPSGPKDFAKLLKEQLRVRYFYVEADGPGDLSKIKIKKNILWDKNILLAHILHPYGMAHVDLKFMPSYRRDLFNADAAREFKEELSEYTNHEPDTSDVDLSNPFAVSAKKSSANDSDFSIPYLTKSMIGSPTQQNELFKIHQANIESVVPSITDLDEVLFKYYESLEDNNPVKKMAYNILAVQYSSAQVESIFSIAGHLYSKVRRKMSPFLLHLWVFVKENLAYVPAVEDIPIVPRKEASKIAAAMIEESQEEINHRKETLEIDSDDEVTADESKSNDSFVKLYSSMIRQSKEGLDFVFPVEETLNEASAQKLTENTIDGSDTEIASASDGEGDEHPSDIDLSDEENSDQDPEEAVKQWHSRANVGEQNILRGRRNRKPAVKPHAVFSNARGVFLEYDP